MTAFLLKAGADGKARSVEGKTAFDYAKNNSALQDADVYRALQKAAE